MDGRAALDESNWESYLLDALDNVILDHALAVDSVGRRRLQFYIVRDFLGYGAIDALMRDPMIEDISCDGPSIPLFLFHRQYESIKTNVVFPDEPSVDAFVIRLAQRCGKQISIAEPILDATLPDKSRLNASLSHEVTTRGSTFTIRKFRADPLTPTDLIRLGTFDPRMAAFFWFSMENGASILFAGGTASGKTTTLNAASIFIPPQKKIVSIEDTREINLPHENWIPGLTRQGFGGEVVAGKVVGTIDMYKLLESALRQRPEYLIVGEVRGPEALTLFQAMATGHATYSTLHADSVPSAVYRLENQPINVPRIMLQTLGAIAIHQSTRVGNRMVRRIKEIVEIAGIDPETKDLLTNTVFQWDPATDTYSYTGKSNILDRIAERRSLNGDEIQQEWDNRTRVIQWMVDNGIRRLADVVNVISAYYSDPRRVLERLPPGGPPRGP
jgi:flagellar protein FlaI